MFGAQLDLFSDRHLRLEDARRALAEGRLQDACRELFRLRDCYPDDPAITAELDVTRSLMRQLGEVDAMAPDERPRRLVNLARAAPASVRAWLLRRAAVELHEAGGPAALLDGKPVSVLWLEAGDTNTAWVTATEAIRDSARARFLAYLADVEHRLDHEGGARARYRDALVLDPYDVDWEEIADEDVKDLPVIARAEFELEDGLAWAAPVGVVLGVLPVGDLPPASRDDIPDRNPPLALENAREFLRALIRAARDRGVHVIDARRQMRRLAPQLLAAYLGNQPDPGDSGPQRGTDRHHLTERVSPAGRR